FCILPSWMSQFIRLNPYISAKLSQGIGSMSTMRTTSTARSASFGHRQTGFVTRLVVAINSSILWLDERLAKRRSRFALLEMTDDQLKDIGISRTDAQREGLRSFLD
ncbi:DUF1127 domain-containing protein, partial [Rhizobiaceae sp. 2RAB30]